MPVDKAGKYFGSATRARHSDGMTAAVKPMGAMKTSEHAGGHAEGHDHAPAHTVHIHNFGGKFHTVGHHEDGSHVMQHGSSDEAHEASKACMGAEGGNQGEDVTANQDGGDEGESSWMGGR